MISVKQGPILHCRCDLCQNEWDSLKSRNDLPTVCPKCKSRSWHKARKLGKPGRPKKVKK